MRKPNWRYAKIIALFLVSDCAFAHAGHPSNVAWRACEVSALNDPCSFQNARKDTYIGTCKLMSSELICVRNQPIQKYEVPLGSVIKSN